ncbi:MAG TPA: asparagine synthase-related protein [Xanthobacteraceae bacterium]|nr:asparagine synthase-related protein [Xanthobacteraceae bacterium]
MSGIFGMLRFDRAATSTRELERVGRVLGFRGDDSHAISANGSVGLGSCNKPVYREDLFDNQPLYDATADLGLVADLRLDNREELAGALDLPKSALYELPDSALLLRAYKKWGLDCPAHLVGDFVFALWDGRIKQLVLGRDHMGQRYVHYHCSRHRLVFATEIKALWAFDDVPRTLSERQIGRLLLRDQTAAEGETLFEDICGLTGATVMTAGLDGQIERRRYWTPHADPAHVGRDEAYYVEAYRRVLGEAVSCRLERTIRKAGLVFSGGYDSAAIAGLSATALAGRKLIAAASVMPADYRGTIRHARNWVKLCARDMPHLDVRYITREGKNFLNGLHGAFLKTELPASAYHFVDNELFSALATAGAQVVMDGHGGDYTLNPRGQATLARHLARLNIRRFLTELRGHLRLSGHSLWTTLKHDVTAPLLPPSVLELWRSVHGGSAALWQDQPINPAFAARLVTEKAVKARRSRSAIYDELDLRSHMLKAIARVMDVPAPGGAAMAASHGLELTRPFHDKRVVEFALAIPQDLYVKNGRTRYLACASLRDIYPPEFQSRWRKNDDVIPDFQRMVKSVEPKIFAEIAEMERSTHLGNYVDFQKIRTLLAARGSEDHNSGWEQETQLAVHGFLVARYVNWFWQSNA